MILKLLTKFYNICTIGHSLKHISSPIYCRHTVSAKMGGSQQRIFFIMNIQYGWLLQLFIIILCLKTVITFYFLILTKQACDRSLFFFN